MTLLLEQRENTKKTSIEQELDNFENDLNAGLCFIHYMNEHKHEHYSVTTTEIARNSLAFAYLYYDGAELEKDVLNSTLNAKYQEYKEFFLAQLKAYAEYLPKQRQYIDLCLLHKSMWEEYKIKYGVKHERNQERTSGG